MPSKKPKKKKVKREVRPTKLFSNHGMAISSPVRSRQREEVPGDVYGFAIKSHYNGYHYKGVGR